jgi:drug/metabolite transporter (DMT)-like permease
MNPPSGHTATLSGLAALALWSLLAVLTTGTGEIPSFQLLALSFGIGGLTLFALLAARERRPLQTLRQPPAAFALTTAALVGYHALYFIALKKAPPVEASLINYLWPLLIVVFAGLLAGQRIRRAEFAGALLGLTGAVLIVTKGEGFALSPVYLAGYLAALAAAFVWSLYSVLNRRFGDVPSMTIAGPCFATALIGACLHALFETTIVPSGRQWLAIAAMGIGPVGAAFWFWDIGTKKGRLTLLGTLAYLTPLLSTAWLLLAGVSPPHWSQAIACALIIGGGLLGISGSGRASSGSLEPGTR